MPLLNEAYVEFPNVSRRMIQQQQDADNLIKIYRFLIDVDLADTPPLTENSPGRAGTPRSSPDNDSPEVVPTYAVLGHVVHWRLNLSHFGHLPPRRPSSKTCRQLLVRHFSSTCHTTDLV